MTMRTDGLTCDLRKDSKIAQGTVRRVQRKSKSCSIAQQGHMVSSQNVESPLWRCDQWTG